MISRTNLMFKLFYFIQNGTKSSVETFTPTLAGSDIIYAVGMAAALLRFTFVKFILVYENVFFWCKDYKQKSLS